MMVIGSQENSMLVLGDLISSKKLQTRMKANEKYQAGEIAPLSDCVSDMNV